MPQSFHSCANSPTRFCIAIATRTHASASFFKPSHDEGAVWRNAASFTRCDFVAYLPPHPSGVAALYLGKREGKDLVYMGKVGTGWSRTVSSQIRQQLDTVVSPKPKLTKPTFFADVEYRDITSEGLLRQSSFKGLKRK